MSKMNKDLDKLQELISHFCAVCIQQIVESEDTPHQDEYEDQKSVVALNHQQRSTAEESTLQGCRVHIFPFRDNGGGCGAPRR